jgi:hypothetical protein
MLVTIPQEHKAAIAKLVSLSDDETSRLLDALNTLAPTIWPHALAKQAATKSALVAEDISSIVDALISLIASRDRNNFSTEKVVNDVAEAAASEGLAGIQAGSPEWTKLVERLTSFLSLERSLGVTSRALNVMTQHKHPFKSARILTDIRTVFSTGDDPQPIAALIVHNLQLTTVTDGYYHTFVAALDSLDLRSVASVINRAIKKEDRLKGVIQKSGLSYIEIVPEKQD